MGVEKESDLHEIIESPSADWVTALDGRVSKNKNLVEVSMRKDRLLGVVKRHLSRTASPSWAKLLRDPRKRRGRRWKFSTLMAALWAGVLTAALTLRKVEELTERMGRRISDTTLWALLVRLTPGPFRKLLVSEVRKAWRAKEMESLLPFSMVAVDGKVIWVGKHKANKYCKKHESIGHKWYQMKVLRATWVSGFNKLTIGQMPVKASKSEMSTFPAFHKQLLKDYGCSDMLEVYSMDAGYASKANAELINNSQRGYIIALKSPQQELEREAQRLLARRRKPDAETHWENYQGKRIRRLLFRTHEMAGWNGWDHLRQVWRIRQETLKDGVFSVEERYFLTNLTHGLTKDMVPLHAVRAHWAIENCSNWTLDTQWKEDDCPWATRALEVVSLMRLLALNVVMRLRNRRFRSKGNRQRSWANLLNLVTDVLIQLRLPSFEALKPESEVQSVTI